MQFSYRHSSKQPPFSENQSNKRQQTLQLYRKNNPHIMADFILRDNIQKSEQNKDKSWQQLHPDLVKEFSTRRNITDELPINIATMQHQYDSNL